MKTKTIAPDASDALHGLQTGTMYLHTAAKILNAGHVYAKYISAYKKAEAEKDFKKITVLYRRFVNILIKKYARI